MKFLLPLFLFFAIAFATTNYRLKVHRVDVADTAAEYVAIKGKDAVLSSTPQSTIAIVVRTSPSSAFHREFATNLSI